MRMTQASFKAYFSTGSVTEIGPFGTAARTATSSGVRAMNASVIAYFACLGVLLALDAIWLTTMNAVLYQPVIGTLLADQPNIAAIVVFYLLYVIGIVYFAINPALVSGVWIDALVKGVR